MSGCNRLRLPTAILVLCCPLISQTLPSHAVGPNAAERQKRMWQAIKEALLAPNGAEYFRLNLDSTKIPGGTDGLRRLRGVVLSSQPAVEPRFVLLGMTGKTAVPEVKLQLKSAWDQPLPDGTEVEFSGVPQSFKLDRFLLTIEAIRFEVLQKPPPQSKPK
jgi:hypothetical protein